MAKITEEVGNRIISMRVKGKSSRDIAKRLKDGGLEISHKAIMDYLNSHADDMKALRDRIDKDTATPTDLAKMKEILSMMSSEELLRYGMTDMLKTINELNSTGDNVLKRQYYDTFIKYIKLRAELIGESQATDTALMVSDYMDRIRKKAMEKKD